MAVLKDYTKEEMVKELKKARGIRITVDKWHKTFLRNDKGLFVHKYTEDGAAFCCPVCGYNSRVDCTTFAQFHHVDGSEGYHSFVVGNPAEDVVDDIFAQFKDDDEITIIV